MFKSIVKLAVIFLALNSYAQPTVWKDGEFLLWNYGKQYVSPADFCFALRYENEKTGNPNCYTAGDWERDTTVTLYAKWLNTNLSSALKAEDLKPRHLHVIERLQSLKDRNLLFSTTKDNQVWFLLFDETSTEPKEIAVFPLDMDSAKVARKIASDWFGGKPQIRLSDAERAAKQKEPDAYYAEQPMHDVWFGVITGWNKAYIPFITPKSWYKRKLNSKIINYKYPTGDSTSVWSYLEDSSPFFGAYIGGSVYDFIGLEFEFHRSSHRAKTDGSDTYHELDEWTFNRYELLLSLIFMQVFTPHPKIEIEPYASASFMFSFFTENISLNEGEAGSPEYKDRFEFEPYYRNVGFNLGLRTAFFKNYAINLRTGVTRTATIQKGIGSSTTDVYVAAGVEYHIRWR